MVAGLVYAHRVAGGPSFEAGPEAPGEVSPNPRPDPRPDPRPHASPGGETDARAAAEAGGPIPEPLAARLARQPFVLLDGPLATRLEARGRVLDDPLWSAATLLDAPQEILAVHREWLTAGAEILTTASYQATIPGLRARGLSEAQARTQLRASVELARTAAGARDAALVAASIGSYGAYLADGSEYRGAYGRSVAELVAFHRPQVAELSSAGPDLLAFETMPSAPELAALAELLGAGPAPRVPAWVSVCLRPGGEAPRLADGTPLAEAVAPLVDHPQVFALGVNCVDPHQVLGALECLAVRAPRQLKVAYPNSGERWVGGRWSGAPTGSGAFVELARAWWRAGARIIGGCCRTEPAQLRALVRLRTELQA